MDRRLFLTALAGGVAATATFGLGGAEASPALNASAPDLAAVRTALSPAVPAGGEATEMHRRRWRRRWFGPRRRRCWINRRGFRVCRW
jgi:hypothetical protein